MSQSVDAQVRQLTKAGCKKVFREIASGAKTDRSQLRKALEQIDAGEESLGESGGSPEQDEEIGQVGARIFTAL